ncbi:protein-L-isoaspartate(D-aspartate) O-methyltransferase [Serpentinimonas maccroryi]|uniref:protein-L-isoaspartate(D-aspartate) O-methyltransferase n=1 Tax=Serpentinimonas maccroryi TaxID=1458426 RepID=UPI000BCE0850|nr:protein-L-isoaspartate(D-aspartate) O-methyltransferase [Serpentinimonas maccroryi]MCM2478459.1 protein-L-isoaspartate(D-aspartate) O-methyltransferase [Serpentinimonas maccroryi]OYX59370.1 MAG: protein-L-isoaspartate O-methyltransferase [Comamonadaceae bacterium 32-67-11]
MNRSKAGGAGPASGAAARPATRPAFPAQIPGLTSQPAARSAAGAQVAKSGSSGKYGATPAAAPAPQGGGLDSEAVRLALVRRLVAQGLQHPAVERAMATVPRHRFVDSALASQAYEDISLPIGLGQTISQPTIVARMLELLCTGRPLPLGRVLEVGTGCGYQAALLSLLCHEVYSIERLRGLHERARENLRELRLPNLHLLLGDGMAGYPAGAPYAGIVAAAAGPELPGAWLEQLAIGGRLVAPTELSPGQQHLVLIERTAQGLSRQVLDAVRFVPLKSGLG